MQMKGNILIRCGGTCEASTLVNLDQWTPIDDVETEANISAEDDGWINGLCPKHAKEAIADINADDARKEAANV